MRVRSSVHSWGFIAACALTACDGDFTSALLPPDRGSVPVHVEVVSAEPSAPASLVVPGVVEARSTRSLAFRTAGRISRLHVAAGSRVALGDAVAEFDQAQLAARVRAAHTSLRRSEVRRLDAARREGRRLQLLELAAVPTESAAPESIEQLLHAAEARYALAMLERAEERLAASVLRAPADGIVDRVYRAEGEFAPPGAPIVRLSELATVSLRAAVPRALLPLVRIGGTARVRAGETSNGELAGEIVRVGSGPDSESGNVPFEVRVENPDFALRPGTVVAVSIDVAGPDARFTIPLGAVRRGIDAPSVSFVVVDRGSGPRIERRRLVLGGLRGDRVVVVSGLAVGDRVVTRGQDLVTIGGVVRIVGEGP